MAKLDSLIVDLQVNTAEMRKGLDEANAKLNDFSKKMDGLAGVLVFEKIGGLALDAGKALATFALHGAESADKMGKMAQSAGISVESFSQLNYAASLADVGTEQLGAAMLKLNQNITKAATGSQEQASLFRELGIAVTDSSGKVRSADDVMADLAEAFSQMADGAAKTTLATEVFGKSGAQLLPMLNEGAAGLSAAADEADRFGLTVSEGAAKSAAEFNDNLTRMRAALDGVAQRVAAQLAPAMATLTNELLGTKEGTEALKMAADALAFVLKGLVSAGVIVGAVFEAIGKALARYGSMIANLLQGNLDSAREDARGFFEDFTTTASAAGERVKGIWTETTAVVVETNEKRVVSHKRSAEAITAAIAGSKKAAEDYKTAFKSLSKIAEDYESKVASFGFGDEALLEARLNTGDLSKELAKLGDNADEMRKRIIEAAKALSNLKLDAKMGEIKFTLDRSAIATQQNISDRRTNFGLASVSNSETARLALETKGFKDFEAALGALAEQTNRQAKLLGEAELLKMKNNIEGARNATLAADEAGRAAAAAGKAADAFTEMAKKTLENQKTIANMALNVLSSVGERGAEVTQLVQSAMQGFSAGGIWGAIIAVIANLFAKLESIGKFIDDAFGSFMEAFSEIEGAMRILFSSLTDSLAPVMRALGLAFKLISDVLSPIFALGEQIMEPFISLAEGFIDLLEATGILEFVVKAVAFVFNTVSLVIGGIILGLQYVWAGILRAVRAVVALFTGGAGTKEIDETIAKHDKAIEENKRRLEKTAKSLDQSTANSQAEDGTSGTGVGGSMAPGHATTAGGHTKDGTWYASEFDAIWARNEKRAADMEAARYAAYSDAIQNGMSYNEAMAAGEAAKEAWLAANPLEPVEWAAATLGDAAAGAAANLNKFSESLTNVPAGFKYNLRKFEATMGMDAPGLEDMENNGTTIINIQGSLVTQDELINILENARRRRNFRQTGSSTSPTANLR